MYNVLLPSLVAALGWGISPFIEKKIIDKTDFQTVFIFKGIITGIFGLALFFVNAKHFLKIKDKYETIKNKKIPLIYLSTLGVVFSYIIGNIAYLFALGENNSATILVPLVSYVMPLIFMTIISFFVTNDKINFKMVIGIIITIFGIIYTLLNKE